MRPSPEARKAELLETLTRARGELIAAAEALPPEKRRAVFLGDWSAADIVAHLIGWDVTNLEAADSLLAGRLPAFYEHHDRDWRSYNAQLVTTYGNGDWEALLDAASASHQRLLDRLEAIPPAEFERDRGLRFRGWKVTIARLLAAEAKDEETHRAQVEAFVTA